MMIPREWLFCINMAVTALMLASSLPSQADQLSLAKEDAFDSVMATYTEIVWRDPLNPSYANLGNDQFLLDTQQGLMLWDEPSNIFSQPIFGSDIGEVKWDQPNKYFKIITWARLGNFPADTLVRVTTGETSNLIFTLAGMAGLPTGNMSNTMLWWDGKKRRFAAALRLNSNSTLQLLSLGPHHALVCTSFNGGEVVRLRQTGEKTSLMWEKPGDVEARAALWSIGVVGKVDGFEEMTEADITRPVYYDTSHCGWEIRNPPEIAIKPFLDKKSRKYDPHIKPYFMADGRILLSEVEYFNGQGYMKMNPPLLWQPETHSWVTIERTSGEGGELHRVGQREPVMSYASRSEFVEFLDTETMHWMRSRQRIPVHNVDEFLSVNIEPLVNGRAVVFLSDGSSNKQQVGLIEPMHGELPMGKLALPRYSYDGEISLHDGGLILVGNSEGYNVWHPSVRGEIIDAAMGQAHPIASLPTPLISPYGLELKDTSILIFGGRCPENEPCSHLLAQPSYRYFPQENRWQLLPDLKIPFTRGYEWLRSDALVRNNGDVEWIEGGEVFDSHSEKLPQTTQLKRWRTENQNMKSEIVASLRKGRTQSTLIELSDGRLAVIGGYAQIGQVASQNNCLDCPNETKFDGTFVPARSTELLDESNANTAVWNVGPKAHYGGGRALKLANGRIFKLSLIGMTDSEGYSAEIADAAFTQWERLPPFPLVEAVIRNVGVASNRVIILTDKDQTVAWDDDAKNWLVWKDWPKGAGSKDNPPISISALANGKRVLIRYGSVFEIVNLP